MDLIVRAFWKLNCILFLDSADPNSLQGIWHSLGKRGVLTWLAIIITCIIIFEVIHNLDKLKKLHLQMQEEGLKKNGRNWLKVNNEFHRVFLDICPLQDLKNLVYEKIDPLGRYWYIAISIPGMMDDGIHGHRRIIEAFEKKDSELVRNLAENHRIIMGQTLRKHLENIEVA